MIRQEGVSVKSFSLGSQAGSPFRSKQGSPLAATRLEQFRQELYASVPRRADALMEVLDALSSNASARSVVELSLNTCFRRGYGSVYDAIDHFLWSESLQQAKDARILRDQEIRRLIVPYVPVPRKDAFWLLGVDVTPAPRPFADTLEDRGFVYQPNCIRGNKPVTIGHQYSALVAFPEKVHRTDPSWVVPLSVRRVGSSEPGTAVGAHQLETLLADETLPFGKDLCVTVGDRAYSGVPFLGRMTPFENLVTIARTASNRNLYGAAAQPTDGQPSPQGHPTWYGRKFKPANPDTWEAPDEQVTTGWTTKRGRALVVHLQAWYDLLLPGTRDVPMHDHPLNLVHVCVVDAEGKPAFQCPMWLTVLGKRRQEVTLVQAWQAYGRRYDLEHFFRFGKQRLLMTASQTPNVEHEENWWQIGQLAYIQLWLARSLANKLPRPWERSLPQPTAENATPTTVQRSFGNIIRQLGTPATAPKPRGNSPGRTTGQQQPPRQRPPVVKKTTKRPKKPKIAA